MGSNLSDITLTTVGEGSAEARFQRALQRVLENIRDPNTDYKAERVITIKVAIKGKDEGRQKLMTRVAVATKLVADRPVESDAYIGKRDGQLTAVAFNPEQTDLLRSEQDNKVLPINSKTEVAH